MENLFWFEISLATTKHHRGQGYTTQDFQTRLNKDLHKTKGREGTGLEVITSVKEAIDHRSCQDTNVRYLLPLLVISLNY